VDLENRVVAITGAAGGIGSALARCFAAHGSRLALLDLDVAGARAVADQLGAGGTQALGLACDVTDRDSCGRAIAAVEERFGGIDVLVNNAGITHVGPVAETQPSVLRAVMDVNFFGAVHGTQAALPSLLARRGMVVVISSIAGFAPLAGRAGYAASKHALHGLFESLRVECRDAGLRVLMVCPGFTDTGIAAAALGPDGGPPRDVRTTTGRIATPDQVARRIVRAVQRDRRQIVLSPVGHASYWLTRLAPSIYERMMARRLLADSKREVSRR
jgi:NAD(P)-dependent dehydrogenase (short-subunit alcohol dehydrogenase family)